MSRVLHRLLRRLLPADFRARHGAAMEDVFAEAVDRARIRGMHAVVRLCWREAVDVARTARALRRGRPRATRVRAARVGLRDDLRYAVRSLVRRPSTTAFAAVTVALGVGSTTAIYGNLEGIILNPLPYENADRMVLFSNRAGDASMRVTPAPDQLDGLQEHTDLLEHIEPWGMAYQTLTGLGETRQVDVGQVRPSFHDLVDRHPVLGRTFTDDELRGEGARVVLLGHALWTDAFGGDPGVLGRAITLDGEPWTVIGVMPERTVLIAWGAVHADVWAPLSDDAMATRTQVTGLLAPGVDIETLNARLAQAEPAPDMGGGIDWRIEAQLARDLIGRGFGDTLAVLMVAVVLLLLVACANVSNLLLSSANARRRETAVRAALGAGRVRLMRQLLLESLLIALLGGALGVGLAFAGQEAIVAMRPERLSALDTVRIDVRVLLFALALTVGSGVLFGLFPAYQASRAGALDLLRSGARTGGDVTGSRFSWGLVAGEVALSFALLAGALLVLSSLARTSRSDVGFRADQVVVLDMALPAWKYDREEAGPPYDELVERLRRMAGVAAVSQASSVPGASGVTFGTLRIEGEEPTGETTFIHGPYVDADYFSTLGLRLLAGRGPTEEEIASGADVVVLGEETARRLFPGGDAVGRRFTLGQGDRWHAVIGVAADVPMTGLSAASAALQGYFPGGYASLNRVIAIRAAAGVDPRGLLPLVRALALERDGEIRIDRLSLASDLLRDTLDRERFTVTVIGVFAAMALLLAAVGLYGVLSHVVGQRVPEIGIRIALGASRRSVSAMVVRRAGAATLVGFVVGVALAIGGIRVMQSRLFGLEESGPATYVLAAAVLGGTSLLAAYVPARRATRVDPVEAMRAE